MAPSTERICFPILPSVDCRRHHQKEVLTIVEKILAHERVASHPGPVVLVADNPDRAGDFVAHAEELSASVLYGWEQKKIGSTRVRVG